MFTGIIEEVGTILSHRAHEIEISASKDFLNIKSGESVSVNGACLTVVQVKESSFLVNISPETIKKTTFSELSNGDKVNLERAIRIGDRLNGHIVLGHVDCVGKVEKIIHDGTFSTWWFSFPEEFSKYLVPKGSISIDGISLTIVDIEKNLFSVAIIPATFSNTNLKYKRVGQKVNLEVDIIGKYVDRILSSYAPSKGITKEFLSQYGFI
ncbi:MAG: riboflavin synthase [Candidatus Hydrogenedentes bacterium]|nr:riboflavin synthase [Candidatus Hydrogenedentota bacterium]